MLQFGHSAGRKCWGFIINPISSAVQNEGPDKRPSYFKSTFHTFDALVIIVGFCLDIALQGTIEEAASLIIVLRLWRVFQIIEELTAGAQEEIDDLSEKIAVLEGEKEQLKNGRSSVMRELEGEYGKLKREVEELRERVKYEERRNGEGSNRELQETPPTPD